MFAQKYRILQRILRVARTNHAEIKKRIYLVSSSPNIHVNAVHNSRTYHSDQSPTADLDHKTELVNLFIHQNGKDNNEAPLQYPWLWLRDNCQCSTCFHPVAQNRTFNMDQLDLTVKPINVQVKNDSLSIKWSDDHKSLFPLDWLLERAFTASAREVAKRRFYPKPVLWGSDQLQDKIPSFNFTQTLENDKVTYQWLDSLAKYGLVLLKNAPCEVGQIEKLAKKISFHRRTHYGDVMPVKVSENPYSLAYTSNHLALHTDTGWSLHPVGVHTFHCIVQAKSIGGENEFVDTFNVALQLKQEHPKEYELLCQTPLYHMDRGKDKFGTFYKQAVHPLFRFNVYGEIDQTIFSNISRDSFLNLPVEKVTPFLKALRLFFDTCYDSNNIVRVKLDEGDIVMFVNTRVLHGRTAYKVEESGERHLETVYFDMEEVLSRRFLLHNLLSRDQC